MKTYDKFVEDSLTEIYKHIIEEESVLEYMLRLKDINNIDGMYLEFGVWSGETINLISKNRPNKMVYGFDSFEGLPEKWKDGYDKGAFNKNGNMPIVNDNVRLIKGWFDETLPTFLEENPRQKVSFLHVDCDLYSSTKTIFDNLKDRITIGTIIVFDELINYDEFKEHEMKAFYEFLQETKLPVTWTANRGEKVGCIIL